ncbi:MAG: trigger factor [Prevotellaceae bacterium]|jgi:trigger factor|nr:trigger factor [Prevotellaceae bacterium]
MKISQKNLDDLNATIALTIEKADYEPRVKKNLNDYRRKAEIKGFRPGMAPMSIVEKMHGKAALFDEVQNIVSESLNKHIEENKLHLLGEPLPNETEHKPIDWNAPDELDFKFDIGIAPKIDVKFTNVDKVPYYKITITDEDRNKYKDNVLRQYGNLVDAETAEADDFIKATLTQGERVIENSYISLKTIEDAARKKPFIGAKVGDALEVDVKATFTNDTDLAAMLNAKKEELVNFEPVFTVLITEVKRFKQAELNQDLYDRIFGENVVTSEAEFNQKADARIAGEYEQESEYRFMLDARNEALKKAQLPLPDDFLKRWLLYANEGKITTEQVDKDFAAFADDLRWQMIRGYITKEQALQVTDDDMRDHARKMARYQFSMYGLHNAPDEQINHYAESILNNEQELKRIYEKVEEDKVVAYIRSVVTLDEKATTLDELHKLYEQK